MLGRKGPCEARWLSQINAYPILLQFAPEDRTLGELKGVELAPFAGD